MLEGRLRRKGKKKLRNKHHAVKIVIITLILLTSCFNKEQNISPVDSDLQKQNYYKTTEKITNNFTRFELVKREYFGTIAKSTVSDNNVNIRLLPSTSSIVIGTLNKGDVVQIRGYSNTKEIINNYEGYWLKISIENNDDNYYGDNFGRYGWIFSQFVDVDPTVNVSTFSVLKVNPKTERKVMTLILEIDRNGLKTETEVVPHKMDTQSFYTFVWSDDISDFLYSDPVGTFKWIPETNEIKNLTNMGSDTESAWCLVTDDNKFLLQDYGTSPGPRGIGIFDIETTKKVFSGTYYRNLDYDGKSITIVKVYDLGNAENNNIDEQSIIYAKKFIKDTPMTKEDIDWKSQGGGVDVIVKYKFNLISMESEYIESNYIHVQ